MISWLDLTWPMMASASLILGLIHGFVWLRHGPQAHLAFAIAAVSVCVHTLLELLSLHATEPAQLAMLLRWMQLPLTTMVISLIWFVHLFLGAGSLRLGIAAGVARAAALVLAFTTGENLNYLVVTEVGRMAWWGGEIVSYPIGQPNPWIAIAQVGNGLLIAYLSLTLISAWRRGDPAKRRAALIVCGAWLFFVAVIVTSAVLMATNAIRLPYLGSPSFLLVILATSYQLGVDLSRSAQLSDQLRQAQLRTLRSKRDLALAARAAELELLTLDVAGDREPPSRDAPQTVASTGRRQPLQSLLDRVAAEDRPAVESALARALAGDRFESEFREQLPDGSQRWLSARGRIEFDEQHRPRQLRTVLQNVSERHAASDRYRNLIEDAPMAILLVDPDGLITLANGLAAEVFGRTRDDLHGRQVDTLVPERLREAHPGFRADFLTGAGGDLVLAGGRKLTGLRADGTEVPIEIALKRVVFTDRVHTLATVTDLTARNRAEFEAAQQRDELAHLSRVTMIGELSGSLAHELNQPLMAILGNAQAAQRILAQDPVDMRELGEILADIVDDDRRAGEVIRRVRSLLRKGHVDHVPVDVNALIADVLRLIRSDLIHRGVEAVTDLSAEVPRVLGDPVQLQQVVVNLIFNACDAMAGVAGKRIVHVRTLRTAGGGLRVVVEDMGTGIPIGMPEKMFEPFETTKAQGMGLGLAVCRTILAAHGGRIWAENVDTGGARVCFEISHAKVME